MQNKRASRPSERDELLERFSLEIRTLGAAVVLFSSTVARRVGMNASDLECAQLLLRKGPMTAGRLSQASGLTTGAITGVVDRLEKAGWVKRIDDPKDRRRIIIQALPQNPQRITGLYDSYRQAILELLAKYNNKELVLILEFFHQLSLITMQEASSLRQKPSKSGKRGPSG